MPLVTGTVVLHALSTHACLHPLPSSPSQYWGPALTCPWRQIQPWMFAGASLQRWTCRTLLSTSCTSAHNRQPQEQEQGREEEQVALLIPLRCQLELDRRQRHLLASGGARASVSLSVSLSSHFFCVSMLMRHCGACSCAPSHGAPGAPGREPLWRPRRLRERPRLRWLHSGSHANTPRLRWFLHF